MSAAKFFADLSVGVTKECVLASDYDALAADFKTAESLIDELRDLFVDVFDDEASYGKELLKRVDAFLHKDDEK